MSVLSKFIENNLSSNGIIEEVVKSLFDNKDLTEFELELAPSIKVKCKIHSDVLETREDNKKALWCCYASFDFAVVRLSLLIE